MSLEDQIACVKRELEMRRWVYPRRVASHDMTKAKMEKEIETMGAVLATLVALQVKPQIELIPRPPQAAPPTHNPPR